MCQLAVHPMCVGGPKIGTVSALVIPLVAHPKRKTGFHFSWVRSELSAQGRNMDKTMSGSVEDARHTLLSRR